MIYLDHAATTSLSAPALETLVNVSAETFGNASSIHSFGRKANQILRQARQTIATALGVKPDTILFTSGGSEANNLAIKGYALENQHLGKHIITTSIEHHSVLHTIAFLEETYGFEVTYLEPIEQEFTAQQLKDALRPDTILVSAMFANNETGQLLPIQAFGEVLKNHQAVFHVDAVQAVGKLPLHPEKFGIDLLSAAGHKFHGPKGVGFLYTKLQKLIPSIHGGKQEKQLRAGTENIPSIAAMAVALEKQLLDQPQNTQHVTKLRNTFLDALEGVDFYVNDTSLTLPYVLNIGFPNQLNEQLLMRLDIEGIAVSSGSACTAGIIQESHVLKALYGEKTNRLKESIRISFSEENTVEEIQTTTTIIKQIIGGAL